jgi:hypothetical protein
MVIPLDYNTPAIDEMASRDPTTSPEPEELR